MNKITRALPLNVKPITPALTMFLALGLLLLPCCCLSQSTITGRVLSRADDSPVTNASVFLSNTSIGGITSKDGSFTLPNIKPGKYALVISDIAFETYRQTIEIGSNALTLPDIFLSPQTRNLHAVTIKYQADPNRRQYLSWFKDEFLGASPLADDCTVVNPDVLDLSYDKDSNTLTASSYDFLVIENKALGYRLKYLLDNFSFQKIWETDKTEIKTNYKGFVLFEQISGTPTQLRRWETARYEVFVNSPMHFLRSALGNQLGREGFRVQKLTFIANTARPADSVINSHIQFYKNLKPRTEAGNDSLNYWTKKLKLPKGSQKLWEDTLTGRDIVKFTSQQDQFALACNSCDLFVGYDKNRRISANSRLDELESRYNTQFTLIRFNAPEALFYKSGTLTDPYSVTYKGVWGRLRVADLLPINYDPPAGTFTISPQTERTSDKLISFARLHPVEKAYLHFDKPYYAAGDTIYFKGYITLGERHNLSVLSGVLHVDLINTSNKIDQSIKLQIVNGITWGDFALPDSLPAGNYRIRAYTRWMQNNGEESFFEKAIPVGSVRNQKVPESNTAKLVQVKADLQFFPEGGELVAGINSRIAFKAIGANGLGIGVTGTVSDNTGKKIAEIRSTRLGMGYFNLAPGQSNSYRASVVYADGSKDEVALPQVNSQGVTLSVDNDSLPKAPVKIEANKAYYEANKGKDYTVLIWSGGYATTVNCKLDSPVITMDIIKRRLFTGVTRITLFSGKSEPICERLIFVQNFDQLSLGINADKASYKTRDKVTIKLNARTRTDSSAIGHFSVSVTDEGKVHQDENDESTILTNLLLTSDLKGYIEQPNYYFAGINDEKLKDLDVVMLTHGYRRFAWKQVLDTTGNYPKYPAEAGLSIKGTAENLLGKPIAKARVALLSTQSKGFITDTADNKGQFHFDNLMFTDTAKFILQAVNARGKNTTKLIYQHNENIPPVIPLATRQKQDTVAMNAYLNNAQKEQEIIQKFGSARGKLLKEVSIRGKKTRPSVSTLYGMADQTISGDEIPYTGNSLAIHLMNLAHGVTWGFAGGNRFIPYLLRNTAPPRRAQMTIVWNNNEMDTNFDVNQIRESIDSILVIKDDPLHPEGVLMFFTTGGSRPRDIASTGILPITVQGFYKAREFYAPKYDASLPPNPRPDLRSTIYWNPAVITDKDGTASFDFYSADAPGSYRVVIEGMDSKGNIGRKVVYIKVD